MFCVIEGLDGCGKSTQVELLENYLKIKNKNYIRIKLPDYESQSSALVKMYLNGDFGDKPEDVNVWAASAFYAVDRYANFKSKWMDDYNSGKDILADRYATSNAIYQLAKLPENEWDYYLEWLEDFEYKKMGIPKPDKVIFLDMPVEISQKLMSKRYDGDEDKKDVHEKNVQFLLTCRKAALYTAKKWGWNIINCSRDGAPRTREEINKDILTAYES